MAKVKKERIDGISSDDLRRIRSALRQSWQYSHMWRLVKKRCLTEDGEFSICESPQCESEGQPVAKIYVDHIIPAGSPLSDGYIKRMFVPSVYLQGLCRKCHAKKTRQEKKQAELSEKGLLCS